VLDIEPPAGEPPTEVGSPTVGTPTRGPAWVEALLASELFATRRRNPRVRVGDDELRRLLTVLDAMGSMSIPENRLAEEARLPLVRIGRYVAQLQDLLNIDGYPVLTATDGAVRFDRALLERQFGL
jgi:hypothetical protein